MYKTLHNIMSLIVWFGKKVSNCLVLFCKIILNELVVLCIWYFLKQLNMRYQYDNEFEGNL